MVKSAPTPSFIVTQSQLLLEFLIVAFDDPAVFGHLHQRLQRGLLRKCGQPVFGGFRFFLRPFDQEAILPGVVRCACNRDGQDARERRQSGIAKFLDCPGANRSPSRPKTASRGPTASPKRADGLRCAAGVWGALHGLVFAAAPARVVAPVPRPWWSISIPTTYCSPSSVRQCGTACPSHSRIGQYHSHGTCCCNRLPNLLQSNLWLGLKLNPFGNSCLLAAFGILTPHFRQIQPPGNRQTRIPRAHRQTHRRLTVILFADLTAVLPGNSHRMLPLLGKTRIIHNPRHHWTVFLHGGQHIPPHLRPASPRRSRARPPPSDAATDACDEHCREPGAQPSARHSCALRAITIPCSSSSDGVCRSACPAAFARPSIYAAKRLCCGPGEERRDPTKTILHQIVRFITQ